MNDQEMKNLWENSINQDEINIENDKLISSLKRKTKRFNKNINRRNLREYIASIFGAIFFTVSIFIFPSFQIKVGAIITLASCLFIIYKLFSTGKKGVDSNSDLNTKDYLTNEKKKLENQITLLNSVLSWYLSPIYIGVVIYFLGFPVPFIYKIIYPTATLILFAVIYYLNKRAVRKFLIPLREKVSEQLSLLT